MAPFTTKIFSKRQKNIFCVKHWITCEPELDENCRMRSTRVLGVGRSMEIDSRADEKRAFAFSLCLPFSPFSNSLFISHPFSLSLENTHTRFTSFIFSDSLSLSQSLPIFLSLDLALFLLWKILLLSLSFLSLTHTHSLSLSLSLTVFTYLSQTHIHSLFPIHSHSLPLSNCLYLSLSLSRVTVSDHPHKEIADVNRENEE